MFQEISVTYGNEERPFYILQILIPVAKKTG